MNDLLAAAKAAASHAYAPYSGYAVGAAVQSADGAVYVGCNVENASYGATICAERVALGAAIAAGARAFCAIAIYAEGARPYPCGICRQVLAELAPDAQVYVMEECLTVAKLLPHRFALGKDENI